jgi:hypothetical protein
MPCFGQSRLILKTVGFALVLRARLIAILFVLAVVPAAAQASAPTHSYFTPLPAEMAVGRTGAVAAPLADGRVLIAGGADGVTVRSAEIFDPASGTFSLLPNLMRLKRSGAAAAPLPGGRVLIAGGYNDVPYTTAESFDPITGVFSEVKGEMTTPRLNGFAVPLPDGDVLVGGGFYEGETLDTAEIFDPTSGEFTALAQPMARPRSSPIAVPRADGNVLIFGGYGKNDLLPSVELFDAATETFSIVNSEVGEERGNAVGAALPNGQVLVAGGIDGSNMSVRKAGLLDASSGAYSPFPASGDTQLTTTRTWSVASPLPDGTVLIAGGGWDGSHETAELFVPAPALGAEGGDFGSVVWGSTATRTVTVGNLGAQPLQIDAVSIGGSDAGDFSLGADACSGRLLEFRETCALTVSFSPRDRGDARAVLAFEDNAPTPTAAPLSGTAVPLLQAAEGSAPRAIDSAPDLRRAFTLPCRSQAKGTAGWRRVVCRLKPVEGKWLALLRRGKQTVAQRQLAPGARRLVFSVRGLPRSTYRLRLIPQR